MTPPVRGRAAVTGPSQRPATIDPMESTTRPEVLLFVVDAGAGHRVTANALVAAAAETGAPFRLRILSLQPLLDEFDFTRRLTGRSMEETYNVLVRSGLTRPLVPLLRALQFTIRRLHRPLVRALARHLEHETPAAVVSLLPNFNAPLRDAVRASCPRAPFLTLLTDLADFPPHFWIEPGVDRVIAGSEAAASQARAMGVPADRISRTSGMVLHPRFYPRPGPEVRAAVRHELEIVGDAPVVLLLFGGKGAREMEPLAAGVLDACPGACVVAICGDNPRLLDRVGRLEARAGGRLRALGFTDRVASYMSAADLLVAKPGPGTLAEALHLGLPVVVPSNGATIPQERYNARFVEESGVGRVVGHWKKIPAAVADLLREPGRLATLRAAIDGLPPNRAVYEALDIIGAQIGRHEAVARRA